jgi:hypothetical protein
MDDDTPNTQAKPVPTVVEIRPRKWERDLAVLGTLMTQMQVVEAIDFYREDKAP